MVLGALAYKSAKKRNLGLVARSKWRLVLEVIALYLICAFTFPPSNGIDLASTDPVPYLIVPAWAFTAYFVVATSSLFPEKKMRIVLGVVFCMVSLVTICIVSYVRTP